MSPCHQQWADFQRQVDKHGRTDAQDPIVAGFPYLRVNRLLASFTGTLQQQDRSSAQVHDWLQQALELGRRGATVEWANLPRAARQELRTPAGAPLQLDDLLGCASNAIAPDQLNTESLRQVLLRARVPDSYSTLARASGGYIVARHLALNGVNNLHEEMLQRIGRKDPRARKWPESGPRETARLSRDQVADILRSGYGRSALGVPQFEDAERRQLLIHFAPVLKLGVATPSDIIGTVGWNRQGEVEVRVGKPATYTMMSATRHRGQVLTQLNYVFWFPRRAAQHMLDPYAGKLDGLIWRVTLRPDGRVLMYDSIHPCGCYHTLYFPESGPEARQAGFAEEPVLVYPARMPDAYAARPVLHISPVDHHVIDIGARGAETGSPDRDYRFYSYDALRSLPRDDGSQQSLFGTDGLVPGTERGERAFLWPLGVISPGQMRQWGHHATAFVGRRHFDDANLLDTLLK